MRKNHLLRLSALLAAAVMLTLIVITAQRTTQVTLRGNSIPQCNPLQFIDGWTTEAGETAQLPGYVASPGSELTLRHCLTPEEAENAYLMLYNEHLDLRVCLDGELLFELDSHENRMSHIDSYCFVRLPRGSAGRELTLTFRNCQPKVWLSQTYLGSAGDLIYAILDQDLWAIVLNLALIFTTLAMIVVLVLAFLRRAFNRKQLWFLLLLLIAGVWAITETNVIALMPIPIGLRCYVSYTFLALMVIPLGFYAYYNCGDTRPKLPRMVGFLGMGNVIVQNILYLTGTASLYEMLIVTQAILGIALVVSCCSQLNYLIRRRPRHTWLQVLCAIEPLLVGLISLTAYWMAGPDVYRLFFQIGVLGYMLLLLASVIYELLDRVFDERREMNKLQTYAEWSVRDILTELGNRRAFEICTEKVVGKRLMDAVLIFLDVNGLKIANDKRGHKAGDELLMKAAACIREAYSSLGQCFRLGGDEFAVVIENPSMDDEALLERLKAQIAHANAEGGEQVSLAVGFSHLYSDEHIPCSLSLWKSNADREMYADKMRAHLLRDTETSVRGEYIDELTGALNSIGFTRMATRMILENPQTDYAIWYADVKKFKFFNDFFGMEMGDRLIKFWADIILKTLAPDELCGRWIGDTLVALVHNGTDEELQKRFGFIAEKVSGFMENYAVELSSGIYRLREEDRKKPDIDYMMNCANIAHLHLKHQNGNTLTFFSDEMRLRQLRDIRINQMIDSALRKRQIVVYLQPQIDYHTGRMSGAEALCRWPESELGALSPGEFIPALERTGQVAKVDHFMWEEVCRLMARWRDDLQMPDLSVSVNISRVDVLNSNIIRDLTELVDRYGLPPRMLRLEITESAYISHPESLISVVNLLHQAGFTVEMDDFGSGFSSLNMLSEMHVDILKMDMRFLHRTTDMQQEERSRRIIGAVAHMAADLNLPVIVEGVETRDQADFLHEIGCHDMQGYYFARPVPVPGFEEMIRSGKVWPHAGE